MNSAKSIKTTKTQNINKSTTTPTPTMVARRTVSTNFAVAAPSVSPLSNVAMITATTASVTATVPSTKSTIALCRNSSAFGRDISLILIINYFLLLLSLCCDVCKSDEYSLLSSSTFYHMSRQRENLAALASVGDAAASRASVASAIIDKINLNTNSTDLKHGAVQQKHSIDNTITGNSDKTIENITNSCMARCKNEKNLYLDEFGIKCATGDLSEKCFMTRCAKGCQQWWRALQEYESCQEACSSLQFYPYDLPCIGACEMSQRNYWHLQLLSMESLVRNITPQLLHESAITTTTATTATTTMMTANSLTLQWPIKFPDKYLASRPFNIQYCYVRSKHKDDVQREPVDVNDPKDTDVACAEADWSNLADYNCNESFNCDILDALMPYTSYSFRFEIPFGESPLDVLYSKPTLVFTTQAEGAPLSSPIIENVLALDDAHVAIFWKAGEFTNGPLTGYKLHLTNSNTNATLEQLIPATQVQYISNNLLPLTNYTLQLCMLNDEGAGPCAASWIITKDLPHIKGVDMYAVSEFILAGEYSIRLRSLEALAETQLIYLSDQLISDYALHLAAKKLFVVDEDGHVFSAHLERSTEREALYLNKSIVNFKPAKIAADWLNSKLYIAGQAPNKFWLIVRSDMFGENLELLVNAQHHAVQQLVVDPINGWLFWSQTNAGIQRMNLATLKYEVIIQTSALGSFVVDLPRNLLVYYDKESRELYELSYDGVFKQKLRHGINSNNNTNGALQGELQSFALSSGADIYATNGTHLAHQNYRTNENDIWFIRELEWCWSFVPQQQQELQPTPQPKGRPLAVQALLTANMAKINWRPPALNALQSTYAWQQWEYELELMDVASNSAFNIRNIKSTYFDVEQLQADNTYKLRVRAVSKSGAGAWSKELLTRTWPLGKHKFLWATAQGFYESNEVGEEVQELLDSKAVADVAEIRTFVQLNGSIFYVANQTLKCANLMNPELSCVFQLGVTGAKVSDISYDWRGGKIYLTDMQRNLLLRTNLDGSDKELLPLFDAQQIEIDSYMGYIYYSTGACLARRTLSGSSSFERQEMVYFHVNGIGGVVRGFALDVARQKIYFVARQNEGHVRLFKSSTERGELNKFEDLLLSEDIVPGSLAYMEEIDSLSWLTATENTSRLVIVRTDNLAHQAHLDVPQLGRIRAVRLKRDYTPYLDASVIPEAIATDSIQVDEDGYWDDFNVRWATSTTADNYTVFYKVLLQYSDDVAQLTRFYTLEVNEPMLHLTEFHQPQLWLNISITPHTYWSAGATASAQLHTPAAAPTQPKRLRVFISQTADPLQFAPNISALIRWDPPENISMNTAVAYKIYCWLGDELYRERLHNYSSGDKPLEARIGELSVGQTYTFQVQAFAVGRASGGEKTAQHVVYVNPEVQAAPILLIVTSEFIAEFDLDLNRRRILVHTSSEVEHLALMRGEQRLLWVNENVELLTFVPSSAPVKLARMRAEVLALTADWVTRTVYWAERDADIDAVSIYKLDLCQFEGRVMMGTKILRTARGKLLRDMLVLPFSQTLLWLEYDVDGRNATLVGRNLTDGALLKFKGTTALLRMFEGSMGAEMETVNLLDHKGKLCKYDVQRLICNPLKLQFDVIELPERMVQVERDNGYVYALQNGSIRAYNRRKQNLEYELDARDVRRIKALNYQEYPPRRCLLPSEHDILLSKPDMREPQVISLEEDFFTLELPKVNIDETCWLPVPGERFIINVTDNADYQRNLTSFEHIANITGLSAFTNYTVQVHVSTYYQQKLNLPAPIIPDFIVRTAAGTPSAPQNFTAYALSPTEVHVHWRRPAELNNAKVWYELHWQMENTSLGAYKKVEGTSVILTNMMPAQRYALWLKVFSTRAKFEVTSSLVVETFEQPSDLQLLSRGPENLTLHWLPPADVSNTILVCHEFNADENEFSIDITNKSEQVVITELEPKTKYEFHLELYYPNLARPYQFPERFIFETLGNHPSSPGKPQIEHIAGEIFKVSWEPARNNGSPVTEYSLEALQSRLMIAKRKRRAAVDDESVVDVEENNTVISFRDLPWAEELEPLEDKWLVYCNTTELSCIVRELYTMRLLMFRVRARNEAYGWGPYSDDSERVLEPFVTAEKRDSLVLAIIAPAAIVSTCVLMLLVFRAVQRRRVRAKKLLEKSRPSIWSNFSTLQQQQLMATRNRAFSVASHSTLYTGGPLSDADIALLPHISWNQITLQNFLGSGAFGEVYEGLVKHEDEDEHEKVAIKTLRKGANEFAELLQEAQLMSNFKHENIVRLIGVCFDTESISIIMEHMEAGDLLSYLRESRPNTLRPNSSLQLLDLMSMCIDVATGCSYLEDMHFVHRDLACRNCLVSSRDRSKRVVKIGDFGLARDIYKNDYYRKEGEGLLPVRWMSPESLVDGVFTTQSDVWAFAVLCWEILTLGQQPYAARNNLDVLNYVKSGGRLEQPENCPDKLFSLMLECWLSNPEERPTFRKCLNVLLSVKTDVRRVSMGYTKDDDVYATYVNNQGIVLSTFLANPMPKLDEEEDDVGVSGSDGDAGDCVDVVGIADDLVVGIDATPNVVATVADVVNEKTNMKVRFKTSTSKEESSEGSINDESKLIKQKSKDKDEEPNYYSNEAVSRL